MDPIADKIHQDFTQLSKRKQRRCVSVYPSVRSLINTHCSTLTKIEYGRKFRLKKITDTLHILGINIRSIDDIEYRHALEFKGYVHKHSLPLNIMRLYLNDLQWVLSQKTQHTNIPTDNIFRQQLCCPDCNSQAKLINGNEIGMKGGTYYVCTNFPRCGTYIKCHPKTDVPVGTLANQLLRRYRHRAYHTFDGICQLKYSRLRKKGANATIQNIRTLGYLWLSKQLGVDAQYCHIANFNIEQCKKVIEICEPYPKIYS